MIVNTITAVVITGKSLSLIAATVIYPSPGQANTVSVTTVPAIKPAIIKAENVRGGISEFFSACFQTTLLDDTPLALASFTYSESNTSNIEDRTNLIIPAEASHPSVTAGKM